MGRSAVFPLFGLMNDPNVEKLFFEWNEGGHFDEPLKRVAKGIAGIIG